MKRKTRAILAVLGAILLCAALFSLTALAEEGEGMEQGQEGEPTFSEAPLEPTEPTEPTEPPVDDPISSQPTDSSQTEPPLSSVPSGEDPVSSTLEPLPTPDNPEPDVTPIPQEEPVEQEPYDVEDVPAPTPQSTRAPTQIQKPNLERPKAVLNTQSSSSPSSSSESQDSGPNYVTFATLNQRNNSLSITLFYGGVGCVSVGVLGLLALLIFTIRGRRVDDRDGIFEEIQEAESRQPAAHTMPRQPEEAYPAQAKHVSAKIELPPSPKRAVPKDAIVPEEASLYTEEFTISDIPVPRETSRFSADPEVEEEPEFDGEPEYYEEPEVEEFAPEEPPAPKAKPRYDTEEILREALRGNDPRD